MEHIIKTENLTKLYETSTVVDNINIHVPKGKIYGLHFVFGMDGFYISVALQWLLKLLLEGTLMFLTISPYAFLAERTKGLVTPMIVSAVMDGKCGSL